MAAEIYYLPKPRLSLRRILFYVITLAAIILIYLRFAELKLIRDLFESANISWLSAIIVLQVLSYYFLSLNYRDVLRVKNLSIGLKDLFPMTFVIQFLNQALPSGGISGQIFFIQYIKKYGLTITEGIGRAVVELLTLYMAFGSFFMVAVFWMFFKGTLNSHPAIAIIIYIFSFFAILFSIIFLASQKKGRGKVVDWIISAFGKYFEKERRREGKNKNNGGAAMFLDEFRTNVNISELGKHKKDFFMAVMWQGCVLLMNVVTLYFISFALDFQISFFVAFVVFTMTKLLAMVAFVPGAIGIFEGGMTLLLISFGIPANPAFAMTLLLRAFTFWLPMPIGWILYRQLSHRQE